MMNEPTFPGCVIEARVLGMMKLIDKGELDYKVLTVPHNDPNYNHIKTFEDVPKHFLDEVEHFFVTYKHLQGVATSSEGWVAMQGTHRAIEGSIKQYRHKFPREGSDV